MDAALRLGHGHTLHAVYTTFKFQILVGIFAGHVENNFTIATGIGQAGAHHFHLPTTPLGVTTIHTEQITGENVGFITARATTNFHHRITAIGRIWWDHRAQHIVFQGLDLSAKLDQFFFRHFANFFLGLLVRNHRLIFCDRFISRIEGFEFFDQAADTLMLAAHFSRTTLVGIEVGFSDLSVQRVKLGTEWSNIRNF